MKISPQKIMNIFSASHRGCNLEANLEANYR